MSNNLMGDAMETHCPDKQTTIFEHLPDSGLIRQRQLIGAVLPFSAATLWRKVRQGAFPSPIRVSSQVTAWRVGDVRIWLADPAGYSLASSDTAQREDV
jgi:predicted DNA-binding transcriptional regulator AlpA